MLHQEQSLPAEPPSAFSQPVRRSTTTTEQAIVCTYAEMCSAYKATGQPAQYRFRREIRLSGTPDRATHNVHPYPGKMLPHVAAFAVCALARQGATVLDPFCGSGTVAVESAIFRRNVIAQDQNPFACLLTRVKTTALDPDRVQEALETVLSSRRSSQRPHSHRFWRIETWYPPQHLNALLAIRDSIQRAEESIQGPIAEFLKVCFLATARSLSLADPAYPVPVRISTNRRLSPAGARHLRNLFTDTAKSRFALLVEKNLARVTSYGSLLAGHHPNVAIIEADSRHQPAETGAPDADLILTSPPYPGAQKYVRSSFPALEWLEMVTSAADLRRLQESSVGRERYFAPAAAVTTPLAQKTLGLVRASNKQRGLLLETYLSEVSESIRSVSRRVRPTGRIALVVSPNTMAGIPVNTPAIFSELLHEAGWQIEVEITDRLLNPAQPTKRHNSAGRPISVEHLLVARRLEAA